MDRLVISATGHRPNKLGGYGDEAYNRLVKIAEQYITEMKPTDIISGMALGWDQAWAHAGINLGVRVHAAIPFLGQESQWPQKSQEHFKWLFYRCAGQVIVCDGAYAPYKMQVRNEWMVNHSNRIAALWNGTSGGTANCVNFAEKVGKPIDNLWSKLEPLL